MPGHVVLTVKTDSPGGKTIQFIVMFLPINDIEYLTFTSPILNYNTDEGAVLSVPLPSGGSYSLYVLAFNSFGFSGTTDSIEIMDVPRENFQPESELKYSLLINHCCNKCILKQTFRNSYTVDPRLSEHLWPTAAKHSFG